jgi:thiaminase (transcriptional activator TenA)
MLHQHLWDRNIDIAQQCLEHPFVQGLGNGSLPQAAFKRYIAQDAFFLDAFVRAYALCAAKCHAIEDAQAFHTLMGGGFEELNLHARYAKTMGIDLQKISPYSQTTAYVNFLLRTAWEREVGDILAALAPCMQLYGYLGSAFAHNDNTANPYQDWIKTYAGPDFLGLVDQLNALLDRLARDTRQVQEVYRFAMQCEFDFFTAPLEVHP